LLKLQVNLCELVYFLTAFLRKSYSAECIQSSQPSWKMPEDVAVTELQTATLLLALGGNARGTWGGPADSMVRALRELEAAGVKVRRASSLYLTEPVGGGRQPPYVNAVIVASAACAPGSLLRLIKQIERRAGRQFAPPMRPRPLDIDVLAFGGRRLAWPSLRRERGRLILPHPDLHHRTFVLIPLLEAAPHWRHPVLGQRPGTLLAKLGAPARTGVRQILDFSADPCNKALALTPRLGATAPGPLVRGAHNSRRGMVAWRA
jgi:2-amino-4-hydroxy-6-hydroxymethyldihydropteridine diphosphokinase